MRITDYLKKEDIKVFLTGKNKKEIIGELVSFLGSHHPDINTKEVLGKVMEREGLETTGIGEGVAIPHARVDNLEDVHVVFGLHREGVGFNALDGKPARIFCLVLYPAAEISLQIRFLARLSRLFHVEDLRDKLCTCKKPDEVFDTIKSFEDTHFH